MTGRYREKSVSSRGLLYRLTWSVFAVICCAALVFVWHMLMQPTTLPFRRVKIYGDVTYTTRPYLRENIISHVNGGFFSLKTTELERALLESPWIKQVGIRKMWPDVLVVTIQERRAKALWGHGGVVSQAGVLFYPKLVPKDLSLPRLSGPAGQEDMVMAQYERFAKILSPLPLSIKSVTLSLRDAWHIQLNDGLVIMLGRERVEWRLQRLVSLYSHITLGRTEPLKVVDLRYPNGMAIE